MTTKARRGLILEFWQSIYMGKTGWKTVSSFYLPNNQHPLESK